MSLRDIGREHVQQAMRECDEIGRADFCEKYGFGYATTYLVREGSRFYDPKALLGAAHSFLDAQEPLTPSDFDATEALAALRRMGFEVVNFNGLWWVNQGSSYRAEREGGYVWAPLTNKAGHALSHHVAVSELRVGQRLIHYAGAIKAVGVVAEPPMNKKRPAELSGDAWGDDGYFCRVEYRDLKQQIPVSRVPNRTATVGPFDVKGNVKQAYLLRIQNAELFPILSFITEAVPSFWDDLDLRNVPDPPNEGSPPRMRHDDLHDVVRDFKNVVLEGVPGTGKSYAVQGLADDWRARTGRGLHDFGGRSFLATVMHPSTSYEDFIEGLRPSAAEQDMGSVRYFDEPAGGSGGFNIDDGFFLRACQVAIRHPDRDVLVLLDELNRCNISSVLGDLLLTLEASRRATFVGANPEAASASDWQTAVPVALPYSRRIFFVPDNLYVVATTNTTDRSVAPIDAAIRRRFAFVRLEPTFDDVRELALTLQSEAQEWLLSSIDQLVGLNDQVLSSCLGPDAMLGHSYLYGLAAQLAGVNVADECRPIVASAWRFSIIPQLIDSARSFGAEDLLSARTRDQWFADHSGEMDSTVTTAKSALTGFDLFLDSMGLHVVVEGTGLSRGARALKGPLPGHSAAAMTADVSWPPSTELAADLQTDA